MAKGQLTTEQASDMIRDIARNSYETGYERGFREAKRRARNIGIAAAVWVVGCLVAFFLLTGCAPVMEVGAGHQLGGDAVGEGPVAHVFLGLETTADGPLSGECGYWHTSFYLEGSPFNDNYESWSDQALCRVRYSWKDR